MTDHQLSSIVDSLYERMLAVIRDAQKANLEFAWQLGRILSDALDSEEPTYGKGIARELARRLNEAGCEINQSTLYGYRSIYLTYERQELPRLIERGLTQTHAQTLASLPSNIKAEVEERMTRDDGQIVSTRELKQMISDIKKASTREESESSAALALQARERGQLLSLEPQRNLLTSRALASEPADGTPAATNASGRIAAPALPAGEGPSEAQIAASKQMAQGPKSFSVAPLRTVKSADSVAIKLLAQSKALLVALDEASRYGFDGARSQQNFTDAAQSLASTLMSFDKVVPEIRQRLEAAIAANTIYEH